MSYVVPTLCALMVFKSLESSEGSCSTNELVGEMSLGVGVLNLVVMILSFVYRHVIVSFVAV